MKQYDPPLTDKQIDAMEESEAIPGMMSIVERAYRCVDGLIGPRSQTGEPYVTLMHSGVKAEGEPVPEPESWPAPGLATGEWIDALDRYVASRKLAGPATLYWRTKPILEREHGGKGWTVYSRLLVSDKPIINGC
ncbi:MAG: hypothetical protein Q7S17_09050 [Xanthobacteraceae bacterium]|nr:hypothetical protein [Xanthobacteraceae bacterium]